MSIHYIIHYIIQSTGHITAALLDGECFLFELVEVLMPSQTRNKKQRLVFAIRGDISQYGDFRVTAVFGLHASTTCILAPV